MRKRHIYFSRVQFRCRTRYHCQSADIAPCREVDKLVLNVRRTTQGKKGSVHARQNRPVLHKCQDDRLLVSGTLVMFLAAGWALLYITCFPVHSSIPSQPLSCSAPKLSNMSFRKPWQKCSHMTKLLPYCHKSIQPLMTSTTSHCHVADAYRTDRWHGSIRVSCPFLEARIGPFSLLGPNHVKELRC